jgi:transposase
MNEALIKHAEHDIHRNHRGDDQEKLIRHGCAESDEAERMIRSLVDMRAIGPELATLLVREAFSRWSPNRRALGSYAGLSGTPFFSGGNERENDIHLAPLPVRGRRSP